MIGFPQRYDNKRILQHITLGSALKKKDIHKTHDNNNIATPKPPFWHDIIGLQEDSQGIQVVEDKQKPRYIYIYISCNTRHLPTQRFPSIPFDHRLDVPWKECT